MCGIAGILTSRGFDPDVVQAMADSLAHRGPDDEGIWCDASAGIALGHRRLAIVDLSPQGHQPMHSADARFVISLNGEIYNHAELRRELQEQGHAPETGWRGHSDTETLLQAIATLGLEGALARSVGMFAFALWDRRERTLSLVRDRFGEKPLYYGWVGDDFLFGSELKAFRAHPAFDNAIDRRAVSLLARRTYIPAPFSIYRGIFKLPPGCILSCTAEGIRQPLSEAPGEGSARRGFLLQRYWDYRDVVRRGIADPIGDELEAQAELERVLGQAIEGQAMADVPVGAFLSGGIDSSTVVALYQKHSTIQVRTYSIGFEECGYDEAQDAKRVAAHLGTVHHEHYVTAREARDVIPWLARMYDEPFADSSQIPTFLVSRFARGEVTVALTGDGGDELFAGYNRHFRLPRLWGAMRRIPYPLRSLMGSALARVPSSLWAAATPAARSRQLAAKLPKLMRAAAASRRIDDIYSSFVDEWAFEDSPVAGCNGTDVPLDLLVGEQASDAVRMMYCDAVSYLPDDVLAKVDRASMAVGLETRVPFLDHRVAELAARIPLEMKVRDGRGKHLVRQLLFAHVPRELVDRPKAGFSIPVGEWIRGPLRDWAEDLLDPRRLAEAGWFDPAVVRRRWDAHLTGRRESAPALWAVLMFQAWLAEWSGRSAVEPIAEPGVRSVVAGG